MLKPGIDSFAVVIYYIATMNDIHIKLSFYSNAYNNSGKESSVQIVYVFSIQFCLLAIMNKYKLIVNRLL